MYCKHCGKAIDDNSTFCKYCGRSQGANSNNITSMPIWVVYGMWFIVNLYLLMGEKHSEASSYFFPFTSRCGYGYYYSDSFDKKFYNFSEFAVYVFILPAILYIIYRWCNKPIDKAINKILNK